MCFLCKPASPCIISPFNIHHTHELKLCQADIDIPKSNINSFSISLITPSHFIVIIVHSTSTVSFTAFFMHEVFFRIVFTIYTMKTSSAACWPPL